MPEIILGDLELHYTEAGHGSPLLLLHGSFSTGADAFGEILPLLAAHCHVLCPDMRGHGATRAAPYGWTVPQLARDMAIVPLLESVITVSAVDPPVLPFPS